jgi:hypothetical protein
MLAFVPLALHAAGADAGSRWTEVSADNGIFAAYADRSSIRREGAVAFMRGLYDFRRGDFTPQGFPFHSTLVEREYHCSAGRVRLLAYEDHAQRLGEGPIVDAVRSPRRWEQIADGSVDAAFFRVACGAL